MKNFMLLICCSILFGGIMAVRDGMSGGVSRTVCAAIAFGLGAWLLKKMPLRQDKHR
jgi:hypothetical protein